jgi:hypothetical protein
MKMTFVWCLSVLAGSVYGQTGATCAAAPGVEAALDGLERESSKSTAPLRVRAEGLARLRAVFPGRRGPAGSKTSGRRGQAGGVKDLGSLAEGV